MNGLVDVLEPNDKPRLVAFITDEHVVVVTAKNEYKQVRALKKRGLHVNGPGYVRQVTSDAIIVYREDDDEPDPGTVYVALVDDRYSCVLDDYTGRLGWDGRLRDYKRGAFAHVNPE